MGQCLSPRIAPAFCDGVRIILVWNYRYKQVDAISGRGEGITLLIAPKIVQKNIVRISNRAKKIR